MDELDDLQHQKIDVRVELSFDRNGNGRSLSNATRMFWLIGTVDAARLSTTAA